MNARSLVLVVVLALAFIGMLAFMTASDDLSPTELAGPVLFGILLVAIATWSLKTGRLPGVPSADKGKYFMGSFGLAFAIWMLGSILLLPLIGYSGFSLIREPWFFVAFCLLALAFYPLVRRHMR